MLEAPPAEAAGVPWRAPPDAETVDALPYIDGDYGDPAVKREVDRLVEEEMRRAHRKPADFLRDLPPVPSVGFQVGLHLCRTRLALRRPCFPSDLRLGF